MYNAIVWQDTRTDRIVTELGNLGGGQERYREKVGLPLATYFSGPKIRWILDNVDGAREKAEAGDLMFGNMDTWVLWNMTGGVDGGVHVTDPTNASRTMLMDLDTLQWDESIAGEMGIPLSMLPEIRSSSEEYGEVREQGVLAGVPIAGILGDQQAATFGQACLSPGEAKNTYGTGNFMLLNTGTEKVMSQNGLLTTVCYKIGERHGVRAGGLDRRHRFAGAVAARQPRHDRFRGRDRGPRAQRRGQRRRYFVPAFSGLFAPYWRSDARGAIVGLTRYVNKGHLARAVLEATAFQTREVIDAMNADSGCPADLAQGRRRHGRQRAADAVPGRHPGRAGDPPGGRPRRPRWAPRTRRVSRSGSGSPRTTSARNWAEDKQWDPSMDDARREREYRNWKKAVTKTFDWVGGRGLTRRAGRGR